MYLALGQDETILGTERSYHFDHWLYISKISYALLFYALFFMKYIALGRGQTTH